MAAGDVIAVYDNTNAGVSFQPAAGVEAVITGCGCQTARNFGATNGVGTTAFMYVTQTDVYPTLKVFINNSVFFRVDNAAGDEVSIHGYVLK